ncbi:phage holin family protein [Paraburkholderia sp. MMS20-SJTR3]|uniref:Phage holin family protein n=1 Tax=Paraburkholderia sejongensis TaxID=2886946 RepID=A0ABS8JQQ5_9BURK|nr:phage holin family protein [Paraburkholderia sp. MMS20-SJTR3]MCC8392182.1 phage holin family protein [Paraburkholderia sp. MMS20-SJTR3]
MSIHAKVTRWRNVGRFCVERVGDYSELLALEIDETRRRLVRELSALVALAVGGLFTLSFLCIAIIATAWQTRYFLTVVWAVAAVWFLVCIVALLVMRTQKPTESIHVLKSEIDSDLDALREALK